VCHPTDEPRTSEASTSASHTSSSSSLNEGDIGGYGTDSSYSDSDGGTNAGLRPEIGHPSTCGEFSPLDFFTYSEMLLLHDFTLAIAAFFMVSVRIYTLKRPRYPTLTVLLSVLDIVSHLLPMAGCLACCAVKISIVLALSCVVVRPLSPG